MTNTPSDDQPGFACFRLIDSGRGGRYNPPSRWEEQRGGARSLVSSWREATCDQTPT